MHKSIRPPKKWCCFFMCFLCAFAFSYYLFVLFVVAFVLLYYCLLFSFPIFKILRVFLGPAMISLNEWSNTMISFGVRLKGPTSRWCSIRVRPTSFLSDKNRRFIDTLRPTHRRPKTDGISRLLMDQMRSEDLDHIPSSFSMLCTEKWPPNRNGFQYILSGDDLEIYFSIWFPSVSSGTLLLNPLTSPSYTRLP